MEKIENTKIGELIKLVKSKKTYIRGKYIREIKKYELQDTEDINNFKYIKKGTIIEII